MILGITGKIGVGKDTAAKFFLQRNWVILDADKIAHELYRPYQRVWKQVVERFGEGILKKNDVIDRQKLKQLVFFDDPESKKALKDLNAIVHPELKRHLKDEVYFLDKRQKNVIIMASLWQELGLFELCEKVLLITAGEALAYERVHKRDGMSLEMFDALNAKQENPENPDFTVVNEVDFQTFYKELNLIVNKI